MIKKSFSIILTAGLLMFAATSFANCICTYPCSTFSDEPMLICDISPAMPIIETAIPYGFNKVPDVAQYKNADWDNLIGVAKGVSINQAYTIANENPDISFFFYTKGGQMVLETTNGDYRVFNNGDAVFFSGSPWWGSAPGLADGYTKFIDTNK